MTKTTNTCAFEHKDDNHSFSLVSYPRFYMRISGNLVEYNAQGFSHNGYKKIISHSEESFYKIATSLSQWQKRNQRNFETLRMHRHWVNAAPVAHYCGISVDSDLSVIVEDGDGCELCDVTSLVHAKSSNRYANDNEEVRFCLNDFVDLCDEEEIDNTDTLDVGFIEARAFESGYLELMFDHHSSFESRSLEFEISNMASRPIIEGVFYNDLNPDDIQQFRANDRKTSVIRRTVKM